MKRFNKKTGQSAVIFGLVLMGLLGFVGIAVDGGLALNEHTRSQSVSDAVSLSAAQNLIENGLITDQAETTGYALAATEGYDNDGTSNTVSIDVTGPFDEAGIPVYYIDTEITSQQPTYFMQLFTAQDQIQQTSDTRVRLQIIINDGPMFDGYGLIAINNGERKLFEATGGTMIYTHSGGVYSAGSLDLSGGVFIDTEGGDIFVEQDFSVSDISWFTTQGGSVITHGEFAFSGNPSYLDGGSVYSQGGLPGYKGELYGGGGEVYTNGGIALGPSGYFHEMNRVYAAGNITSSGYLPDHVDWATAEEYMFPVTIPDTRPNVPNIQKPDCSDLPDYGSHSSSADPVVINPGNYTQIVQNGGTLIMNPGLYCIGGNITFNGGATVIAQEVLFYVNADSDITVNGGADLQQSAPISLFDASGYEWIGMAFFLDYDYDIDLSMSGGANSSYSGTIYGPLAECVWTGNVEPIFNKSQIVCGVINISGSVEINFDYDPDAIFQGGSGDPLISLEIID